MNCPHCGNYVFSDTAIATKAGEYFHVICYDVRVACLEAELEAFAKSDEGKAHAKREGLTFLTKDLEE